MIRIILVDDHTMVREALHLVLEQDSSMRIVAEVGDGEQALRIARELAFDVVLMDVVLPGQSGIETTRRMLAEHPGIKVLALSTHLDRGIILQMLEAGACGYIVKSAAGAELKRAIRSVLEGRRYLCPEATSLMTDNLWRDRRTAPGKVGNTRLSQRELQVATFLAGGMSVPKMAVELNISRRTVETHRRNIMRKLDLHSVVGLTRYAIRTGLILA